MKTKKMRFDINTWLPIIIFVLILVIFSVVTGGALLNSRNILNIFNQSVATILAGLGMLFVAAMGSTDISTGSCSPGRMFRINGCTGIRKLSGIYHHLYPDRYRIRSLAWICKCKEKSKFLYGIPGFDDGLACNRKPCSE